VKEVTVAFDCYIPDDLTECGWMGRQFIIDVEDMTLDISGFAALQEQLAERGDAAKVTKNRQNPREQGNITLFEKGCESSTTLFLQTIRTCVKQGFLKLAIT